MQTANRRGEVPMYVDDTDSAIFNKLPGYFETIESWANEFLEGHKGSDVSNTHKKDTYTDAPGYFLETLKFHKDPWVKGFLALALKETRDWKSVVDAGCSFGITGLCFAFEGRTVTFHDFPGLPLDFLQWVKDNKAAEHDLNINIIPYGEPIRRHALVVAFDVLEHTGNHLATIKWLKDLGDLVALTYPCRVAWKPPYEEEGLDEWVDDEAIMWVLFRRHLVFHYALRYEWRSVIYG